MSTTFDNVVDIAPELSSADEDRVARFIAMAERWLSEDFYGDLYDDAVAYLTAHLLTLSGRTGVSGSVTSSKVGDLSRTYGAAVDSTDLDATTYGQTLKMLRAKIPVTPMIGNQE